MSLVTPASLALVSAVVIALVVACCAAVIHGAFEGSGQRSTARSRWQPAVWMGVPFLIVFSARLLLMRETPVRAPYWDQWDIEAGWVYLPYHAGQLSWRTMLSIANEHRVFFTRLLALDLLIANGQWDPRLQQTVDAAMHALAAVLLVAALWVANDRRGLDLLVFVGALSMAPPFAWENVLCAFQSVAPILLLFSVLSLWLVSRHPPGSIIWLLGWICAVCALLTFASGIVIPLAIVGMAVLAWANDRRNWRGPAANTAAAALILALGAALAPPAVAGHAPLKAATLADLAGALGHNLSWPWVDGLWPAIFMWLPVTALLAGVLWRRGESTLLERVVVGLAIWVALHAVTLAYGRGAGAAIPAPRYLDYLSLGFVANAVAVIALLNRVGTQMRRFGLLVLAGWLVWVSAGVDRLTMKTLADLTTWRQYFANHVTTIRQATVSGNYAVLMTQPPLTQLPYPSGARLEMLLRDPYVQQILPAAVRAPIRVDPRVTTNRAFTLQLPDQAVPYDPMARAWWSLAGGRRGTGRFESEPMACAPGTRLRFQVSGYLGWPNEYLAVRDLATGREQALQPAQLAREQWEDADVSCPAGPFAIVAIDEAHDSWFGFREPVEIGRTADAVEWLIEHSRGMLFIAFGLAVLAVRWK